MTRSSLERNARYRNGASFHEDKKIENCPIKMVKIPELPSILAWNFFFRFLLELFNLSRLDDLILGELFALRGHEKDMP